MLFEGCPPTMRRRAVWWSCWSRRIGESVARCPSIPFNQSRWRWYTKEQFRDITRSPEWASGAFDGRIKIPVRGAEGSADELNRVLQHELVHAMVATLAGPSAPVWVNEGLASALEPGGVEWAEEQLSADATRASPRQLQRGFGGLPPARQARAAYAQSALAVRKMLDLRGAPAVVSMLQSLGRGTPFETAFQQAIFMRYEDFERLVAQN